jgi:transcriptional regulator with XRE-family HTH domain
MPTVHPCFAEIEARRKLLRWPTDKMAEALGVTEATLSRYRTGARTPDEATIQKMRAALDVEGDALIAAVEAAKHKGWARP